MEEAPIQKEEEKKQGRGRMEGGVISKRISMSFLHLEK
jgi:hypothetical protein